LLSFLQMGRGLLLMLGAWTAAACPWADNTLTPWPTSWEAAGEVVVPAGTKYLLTRGLSKQADGIVIKGTVVLANADANHDLSWIRVDNGGALVVGSEACPITQKIAFTFHGARSSDSMGTDPVDNTDLGVKGLAVATGGSLQMYGSVGSSPSWSFLTATAAAGSKTLVLGMTSCPLRSHFVVTHALHCPPRP
jgi:cell migration-inducing and hyaluronan-binding protein